MRNKLIVIFCLIISFAFANIHFNNHKNKLVHISQVFPYKINNWQGKDISASKSTYEMIDKDEFLFRKYVNTANKQMITLAIVLTNKRDHIHDPEICYTGQGISMKEENPLKINSDFIANYVYGNAFNDKYNMIYWYTDLNKAYNNRTEFMKSIAKSLFFDKPLKGFALVVILGNTKESKKQDLIKLANNVNNYLKVTRGK